MNWEHQPQKYTDLSVSSNIKITKISRVLRICQKPPLWTSRGIFLFVFNVLKWVLNKKYLTYRNVFNFYQGDCRMKMKESVTTRL